MQDIHVQVAGNLFVLIKRRFPCAFISLSFDILMEIRTSIFMICHTFVTTCDDHEFNVQLERG